MVAAAILILQKGERTNHHHYRRTMREKAGIVFVPVILLFGRNSFRGSLTFGPYLESRVGVCVYICTIKMVVFMD